LQVRGVCGQRKPKPACRGSIGFLDCTHDELQKRAEIRE